MGSGSGGAVSAVGGADMDRAVALMEKQVRSHSCPLVCPALPTHNRRSCVTADTGAGFMRTLAVLFLPPANLQGLLSDDTLGAYACFIYWASLQMNLLKTLESLVSKAEGEIVRLGGTVPAVAASSDVKVRVPYAFELATPMSMVCVPRHSWQRSSGCGHGSQLFSASSNMSVLVGAACACAGSVMV